MIHPKISTSPESFHRQLRRCEMDPVGRKPAPRAVQGSYDTRMIRLIPWLVDACSLQLEKMV
jgi:hypothetical protein